MVYFRKKCVHCFWYADRKWCRLISEMCGPEEKVFFPVHFIVHEQTDEYQAAEVKLQLQSPFCFNVPAFFARKNA